MVCLHRGGHCECSGNKHTVPSRDKSVAVHRLKSIREECYKEGLYGSPFCANTSGKTPGVTASSEILVVHQQSTADPSGQARPLRCQGLEADFFLPQLCCPSSLGQWRRQQCQALGCCLPCHRSFLEVVALLLSAIRI